MTDHQQQERESVFWSVLDAVLYLEVRKGHLLWTLSDLSRTSKITRSLIYYYFGKEKEQILKVALKMFGEEFFGFNDKKVAEWRSGNFTRSIRYLRTLMSKAPYLGVFYMSWRHKEHSEVQKYIIELEENYMARIKTIFPHLSDGSIRALFAIFLGFVLSPVVKEEDMEQPFQIIAEKIMQG